MIQNSSLSGRGRILELPWGRKILLLLVGLCSVLSQTISAQKNTSIYLNPSSGNDANAGTKDKPLKSLWAAAKIVNEGSGDDAVEEPIDTGNTHF